MGGRGSKSATASQLVERQVAGNMYLLTAEQVEELNKIDREIELMQRFRGQLADNVRSVVNHPGNLTREEWEEEFAHTISYTGVGGRPGRYDLEDDLVGTIESIRDVVDFAGRDRRNTEANIKILEERKRKILQNARRV